MLTFTRKDGQKFTINGKSVLRVRQAVYSDDYLGEESLPGNTRIDTDHDYYAMEALADVVAAVKTELSTLVEFHSRTGVSIWINAKEATGPLPVSQSEIKDGIHSRLTLGGRISLLVGNTHQEVHDAISAAGGNVQPMPTDGGDIFLQASKMTVGKLKTVIANNYGLPKGAIRIVDVQGEHPADSGKVAQLLKGWGNKE